MSVDNILTLAFGIPFCIAVGTGLGIFVVGIFFGIDLTRIFRRDKEDGE